MTCIHTYHDVSLLPSLEVICFVEIAKVIVLCVSCRSYIVLCVVIDCVYCVCSH